MLRLGNFLCNKRHISAVELRRRNNGADVCAYVHNCRLQRHFERVEDAQQFLERFAAQLAM